MRVLYLILIILPITGCERDNGTGKGDFRDPYTGSFHLTSIKHIMELCYDSSSTCIDGWGVLRTDTSFIQSEIKKYDSNKIEFQFANGNIGTYNGNPVLPIIYPILNEKGELITHIDFAYPGMGTRFFQGNFNGHDTLEVFFEFYTGGLGTYFRYEILGIRED
jgi:hypothetical protein